MCVVGRVGSGKSSLVQALLGEMEKAQGAVKVGQRSCLGRPEAGLLKWGALGSSQGTGL